MFNGLNERVKGLTAVDVALVKWTVLFTTIIIVKIFPQLLTVSYPVLIILAVACGVKPTYKFWFKRTKNDVKSS